MAHHAWRIQRATGVDHASDHMLGRDGFGNEPLRIDGVERRALQLATKALEKPPGHTVHGRHHRGVGGQQRRDALSHIQHGRCFDRHDDQILGA